MHLVAALQDRSLGDYAERLKRMGAEGKLVLSAALNAGGDAVRKATVAAETRQTGLDGKTVDRSQRELPSTPSSLSFKIRSQGGDIRLKYFGAKETDSGVLAHPLGDAQVFAHTFMKGGRFPDRVSVTKLGGQVYRRVEGSGRKMTLVRSGVRLPAEMVTGRTKAAFKEGVATIVASTVVTRLGAMLP